MRVRLPFAAVIRQTRAAPRAEDPDHPLQGRGLGGPLRALRSRPCHHSVTALGGGAVEKPRLLVDDRARLRIRTIVAAPEIVENRFRPVASRGHKLEQGASTECAARFVVPYNVPVTLSR